MSKTSVSLLAFALMASLWPITSLHSGHNLFIQFTLHLHRQQTASMYFSLLSVLSALGAISTVANAADTSADTSTNGDHDHDHDDLCLASCANNDDGLEVCKFHASVDLHAGELGYYKFKECGDKTNPTLGMEVGKTYEFVQTDRSNYYHPLGFAYYPDGAHAEADELEPGIVPPGSTSTCGATMSCPAPMYFMDGNYQGAYSNIAGLREVSSRSTKTSKLIYIL